MCAEWFLVVCEKYMKYFLNQKKGERKENTDCYKNFRELGIPRSVVFCIGLSCLNS